MRFLTPLLGPNSSAIATRGGSICPTDTFPSPTLTGDVGGLSYQLKALFAASDPVDDASPLVTSAETVMVVSVPGEACITAVFAEPPPITTASKR